MSRHWAPSHRFYATITGHEDLGYLDLFCVLSRSKLDLSVYWRACAFRLLCAAFVMRGALVDKIRVLLANHPRMIPDALRELIAEQEDMELVGDCRGPMKILQETGRVKADATGREPGFVSVIKGKC